MALDFYSTLDQLINPTHNMGGGAGPQDSQAIAQLILGGGSASVQGADGNMVPIMGQGVDPSYKAAVSPQFRDVLAQAEQMAAGARGDMAGKAPIAAPGQPNQLVANPYGPGSYDPTNPAAVAQVQAAGAEAKKAEQARALIQQLQGERPSIGTGFYAGDAERKNDALKLYQLENQQYQTRQQAAAPVIARVLESLGIGENDYKKAFDAAKGKAEGERAGGKGTKGGIPSDLMKLVGKPGFDERLTSAIDNGEITKDTSILRLETMHNNEIRSQRVEGTDRRVLSGLKSSMEGLTGLLDAYEQTPAFKTGKFSDAMKAALNTNNTAATWEQIVALPLDGQGFTDADRQFAAKYNAVRASLRDFSSDTRFSDTDKLDVLRGIGNPFTGSKQFPLQVQAMRDRLLTRQTNMLEDIEATGRDTSKLRALRGGGKASAEEGVMPNGKRWRKVDGKIQIEG
jgi:hypothetical protein